MFGAPDDGVSETERKRKAAGGRAERRVKLRGYESAPAVFFNPYGKSAAEDMSVKDVWQKVAEGSYHVAFHSELAATSSTGGPYRVGIGLSRLAESLLAALAELQQPVYKNVIDNALLRDALHEGVMLQPYLQVLHAGKATPTDDTPRLGFSKVRAAHRAAVQTVACRNVDDLRLSAAHVWKWLQREDSHFRRLLGFLSGEGCFLCCTD